MARVTEIEFKEKKYNYYQSKWVSSNTQSKKEALIKLGHERLNPKLSDPNFLIYRERRKLFSHWIQMFPNRPLRVLDVGGRIQPYRLLVGDRLERYVAVDPQLEGLVDVIAIGEDLPFTSSSFDLVICTQVLSYVKDPSLVIREIYRVLKQGAVLLMSVPSLFPCHHDERWRFLPDGMRILLSPFSQIEIAPEGYSVAGVFRTVNVCINILSKRTISRYLLGHTFIPMVNLAGMIFDRFSFGNEQFTTNYSIKAIK